MSVVKSVCHCCGKQYNSVKDYLNGTTRFRICTSGHLWFNCSCKSGMILEKGQYDWFKPEVRMSERAQAIFTDISQIQNIPLIPSSVIKLQEVLADESSSSVAIKEALKEIPNLALNLLKAASSLSKFQNQDLKDIEHAISYMGRGFLCNLVYKETIANFEFKTSKYTKEDFWKEANQTGRICEFLTTKIETKIGADEAYIAGSLCNIGKIIQAICYPQKVDDIYQLITDKKKARNWVEAEKAIDLHSHEVLGEIAASLWGFPEDLIQAIGNHHTGYDRVQNLVGDTDDIDAPFMEDTSTSLQQLVFLANQLSHWVLLQPHRMQADLFSGYCQSLNLSEQTIDEIVDTIMHSKP